jgi:hypothetical protein
MNILRSLNLDPEQNHIFGDTDTIRKLLFAVGFPNGLPDPSRHVEKCGIITCLRQTEHHYALIFRYCNCEGIENADYSALLLAKKTHTELEAAKILLNMMDKADMDMKTAKPIHGQPKENN